jgi:hypothetical protein
VARSPDFHNLYRHPLTTFRGEEVTINARATLF